MQAPMDVSQKEKIGAVPSHLEALDDVIRLQAEKDYRSGVAHGMTNEVQLFQDASAGKPKRKLVPRPTEDPKDPLSWSLWRKHAAFGSALYFVFLSNYTTGGISPVLVDIVEDFKIGLDKASYLISLNILFLGAGNLFWVPLSGKIGKRPVFVACALIYFAACVWAAKSSSYGSLLAARVIQGFGASPAEALGPAVVADLYFLHERGSKIGVFTSMIGLGSALGGIFAGLVAESNPNWRWVFWMDAILTGVLVTTTFLFLAETAFRRPKEFEDGYGLEMEEFKALKSRSQVQWSKSIGFTSGYDRGLSVGHLFVRPLSLLRYPAVIWAAITHGVVLGWVVLQQTGYAIFLPALYHFSPLNVGNVNIANIVGAIIGSIVGGPGSDVLSVYLTKHRDGYFKPELRLWALLPPALLAPVGVLLWGCGFADRLSPMVIIAGTGITYGVLCSATATSMTYAIDCYRPVAAEVVMILVAFRNILAFGFSFAVVPWIETDGFVKMSGYMTLIEGIVFTMAVPMYIFGPGLRRWTSKLSI